MLDALVEDLRARQAAAQDAVAALAGWRRQVEENARYLEGPNGAFEYIDFFADLFTRAAQQLEQVAAELPNGVQSGHIDALRQIASNSAAEQRRSVMFRDKWINKPLPYETMRPLLSGISATVRDQTEALRSLSDCAASLEAALPDRADQDDKAIDRRHLFTRFLRPPDE